MDINNDGKLDLVAGDTEGNVWFFQNVGTKTEPKLAAGVKFKSDEREITAARSTGIIGAVVGLVPSGGPNPKMGIYSKLNVADWDGDGLLDILIGQTQSSDGNAEIVLYRNIGSATAPKFTGPTLLNVLKGNPLSRPSPYIVDWDGDGKLDMLVGTDTKEVYFLRNTGSNQRPEYAAREEIKLAGLDDCYRVRVTTTDWNNDGKLDLLVGTFYSSRGPEKNGRGGNVWLFLRK